jgi:hypothetical protein
VLFINRFRIRPGSFLKIKEEAASASIEAASEGYRASRMARSHDAEAIFLTPSLGNDHLQHQYLTFSFPR